MARAKITHAPTDGKEEIRKQFGLLWLMTLISVSRIYGEDTLDPQLPCDGKPFDLTRLGIIVCLMDHSPGFLKLVNEARPRVKEVTMDQASQQLRQNPGAVLLDVREDMEWQTGHAKEAVHLGKGILERDLEKKFPDKNAEIIMYCGGGYRSILTCDVAQRMGYRNVFSLIGGYKGLIAAQWPMQK